MSKKILFHEFLLILVTIIWGFGFIAQAVGGSYLSAFTFNFLRNAVAAIFIGIIALSLFIFKKKKNNQTKSNKKNLLLGGSLIGIALAVAMNLQQIGINLEGAGKSGFITSLYMVFVPIFSLFFGKRIGKYTVIAIILALTGLYLIDAKGGFSFSWGTVALLGCAIAYAIQIMLIDKYSKDCDSFALSFMEFSVGSLCCLPLALIFGKFDVEGIKNAMPSILYLGIVSSGVAYTVQIIAQKEVNVTIACIIMSMESVFSLLFGATILHESHMWYEYLGCFIILVAVLLSQIQGLKKTKNPS